MKSFGPYILGLFGTLPPSFSSCRLKNEHRLSRFKDFIILITVVQISRVL